MSRPNAAISAANARKPKPTSRCRIRISAIIMSVRQSTRRLLTTFSVFTSVSPQHEADNDAKRESRSERGNRTVRYEIFDVIFLLAQGLAEVVQRSLDLIGERVGSLLRGIENSVAGRAQQALHVALKCLQLVCQFACVEHPTSLCCI